MPGSKTFHSRQSIAKEIATLDSLPVKELKNRWRLLYGSEPPHGVSRELLTRAVRLRHDVLKLPDVTDTYRLIHAEGDWLSGIVIDRYGDTLSAEAFGLGLFQRGQAILERLARIVGAKHWLTPVWELYPAPKPKNPTRLLRALNTRPPAVTVSLSVMSYDTSPNAA